MAKTATKPTDNGEPPQPAQQRIEISPTDALAELHAAVGQLQTTRDVHQRLMACAMSLQQFIQENSK